MNNNENNPIENKPIKKGGSGTGVMSSLIFLVIVIIGMIVLAHFRGS